MSIIKYYKGNNTFENIRYITKCDNNGITALNLVDASRKLGFDVRGIKCNYTELEDLRKPLIAHLVLKNGYNHFIVIKKIDNKYVYVFDPAVGNKKYKMDYFINIWDNIIIELIPNRKLDNVNNKNIILFKSVFKDNLFLFIIITIVSFISIILTLLSNYYFKSLIDNSNILIVFIFFLFIILIKEIVDYIRNIIIIKLENNINKSITINTHNKLLSLPYYYFNSRSVGDIISKIHDLDYVKELFVKIPIFLFVDLILLIFLTVILVNINLNLYLMFLIISIFYFIIILLFNNNTKRMIRNNQDNYSLNNEVLIENIKSINTIKNLNIINHRCDIFDAIYNRYLSNNVKYEKFYNIENFIKNLILFIGVNVILYVGIIYVKKSIINLGDLILFNSLILYYIESLKSVFDLNPLLKNSINALKRIKEIYSIDYTKKEFMIDKYDIVIKNLCFSYDGYNNILENFNYNIEYKEKIVVVGASGSGKSTLFKLINKTYEVEDNSIYINNIDINTINTSTFITYVSQEEILFKDSLYNNLVLDKKIHIKHINNVIEITGLDKVMINKKIGFNSIIEENGINFSRGERQKIILTRVLLRNNKILILDEALNGIEEDEECIILERILKKYKNKTIIYITHRKKCINLFKKTLNFKEVK